MNKKLFKFVEDCGVIIFECDKSWGGKWGYCMKDSPHVRICGFKTKSALYDGFLLETFGEHPKNAILELLK